MCSGSCFLTLLLNETVVSDSPLSLCSLSDSSSGLCSVDGLSTQSWFWSGPPPPPPNQNKGSEAAQRGVEGPRSALKGPTASLCWTAVQSHTTLFRHRWDVREQLRCIRWNKLMKSITSQTSDQLMEPVRVCCLLLAVCCHYNKQLSAQAAEVTASTQITDFININIFIKNVKCCMWGDEYDQRRLDL